MPSALRLGDRVAVVAPAGPVRNRAALQQGLARLRARGLEPVLMPHCEGDAGMFAASDDARAADLQAAFDDSDYRAILCARGGYGALRLLGRLDWSNLRRDPRPLLGYSDITVLLAAAWREAELIGLHGPMVANPDDYALDTASDEMQWQLLSDPVHPAVPPALADDDRIEVLHRGQAEGRLCGGNLALVTALLGTPWQIDPRGAILFLEDIDEPPYRVDRMLTQLRLAGYFRECAAVMFGDFTPPRDTPRAKLAEVRATIAAVIDERCADLDVPTARGWPFGHRPRSWTLPFGGQATLDLSGDAARFALLDPVVRAR